MTTSTISKNNQTTIPREVRERLGIKAGDTILYEIAGDTIILKAAPSILDLAGIFKIPKDKENVPFNKVRDEARKQRVKSNVKYK